MTRVASDSLLCPSAPAEPGALVIGVVGPDGSIAYIRDRLPATKSFLEAQPGSRLEERYRFSSPCVEGACRQWAEGRCSLPSRLSELLPEPSCSGPLPRCSIRAQCRWFRQSGADACRLCPVVVTTDGSAGERAPA